MSSFRENDQSAKPPGNVKEDMLLYTIGAISEMYGIHPQTLRMYDREGLLKPARTSGNTRMYSRKDVQKLEMILRLTKELGVNRAGAEIIMRMRTKMEELQDNVNGLLQYIRDELAREYRDIDTKLKSILENAPQKESIRITIDYHGERESNKKESQ